MNDSRLTRLYIAMEQLVDQCEDACRPGYAESVRDIMDGVWGELNQDEIAFLNGRGDMRSAK